MGIFGLQGIPGIHLLGQGLHGGDVDAAALGILEQHAEDGEFRADGFPAARGRAHEHVVVAVVHRVENWGKRGESPWI